MTNATKTVLITGANSGIGLEAAAQFAEANYGTVILACRSLAKAESAQTALVDHVGKDVFDIIAIDVAERESAQIAAETLSAQDRQIDVLVLNAGMSSGDDPAYNSDGIEMTFASSLLGHHVLTMSLLNNKKLSADAHIIIAGSEGARGDMPMMTVPDFNDFADTHFDGDLEAMHHAIWKIQPPYQYQTMNTYVTGKVYVAWWAAALASKLPAGMTVNAVSPGSVPNTNFLRHQGWLMRNLMAPMMKLIPKSMGMAASVEDAARRYLDASSFTADLSGQFFASAPGKMVGTLERQSMPHFLDEKNQQASWNMLTQLSQISLN
ncbi:MAG: SDR family NAD(P)-dependent oxidoreductase [Anaerolineae bacterium]|jgi:NAD(P)-dependent dehydrogenase (short-subunit alcohol dehydrogenase family)|nr:SDR family NAD(P)-dependent oxidoreductase [Anaerolineae bacterium]MBT3714067.1 SDR family NAD(P)-dependent oxidoreductase [Anaerolineae bacterium]MBT4310083.1 SDR family NAD(P)-dependent oxidoreductase [Anaerolineae bacterium]MBT4457622.1 SDR family NAD(P)-dependent oxidoreductase [Anaerolineae bacterium]MBT4841117.1 SDR family NAD(P)-dependent oxidoreductase [Anaerolineae bacterium]